jgi:hypothetical protein
MRGPRHDDEGQHRAESTGGGSSLRVNWKDDDDARQILKAATNPATTSDFVQIQSTRFLEMLAPDCAALKVLNLGNKLSLDGINTIKLPFVGGAGRPAKPAFVAEGAPAPVANLATSSAIPGPTCKVLSTETENT